MIHLACNWPLSELYYIKDSAKDYGYTEEMVDRLMTNQRKHSSHFQPCCAKTTGKLSCLLGNSKDAIDEPQKPGIYRICCQTCPAMYIGHNQRNNVAETISTSHNMSNLKNLGRVCTFHFFKNTILFIDPKIHTQLFIKMMENWILLNKLQVFSFDLDFLWEVLNNFRFSNSKHAV